jgi:type I restriction enzyme S subunit
MSKDWALLRLGDFLSELPKSTLPASCSEANGAYAFYCSSSAPKATDTWLQEQPAILMGTGGVASVHLGKGRYAYSTDTWAIRIKESSKLTQPYVYRVLELSLPKIDYAGFEGSGLRHLRKSYIKDFRFLAPSDSASQRRIVSILSGIDTAIEKTEALIAKYQQIKAGLMHDLFTRGVLPNGQLRSPDQSVQTAFGKIPAEWRLGSILELTDTQRQPILTGPFGADLGNADFVAEGVPVLRIGNVQQGRLDLEDLLYVTPRKATTLSRYRIKEGDLLFARQGATTGRNALADERVEGCLINYHIIRVALDQERCAPLFVEAAFTNEVIKRQIERDKGRGTREGINTAQLTSLAFPIAPVAEQRLIAAILSNHNRLLKATEAELHSLRMEKLGLMQDLLTGKVPVKVGAGGMANG